MLGAGAKAAAELIRARKAAAVFMVIWIVFKLRVFTKLFLGIVRLDWARFLFSNGRESFS